jgi:hypothetical protein
VPEIERWICVVKEQVLDTVYHSAGSQNSWWSTLYSTPSSCSTTF